MSMKDSLNKKLGDIVNQIATIESKSDKGEQLTEADLTAYKSLNAEGVQVRQAIEQAEASEALKAFAAQPDGQSAARKAMSGSPTQVFTTPEDREQERRAQDEAHKSPYSSAFDSYMVNGLNKMGPNDREAIKKGIIYSNMKADFAMKVLQENQAQGGGYLVPEQFQAEVLKKTPGLIALNDNVRAVPTTRDVVVWPIVRYSTSNAYTAPHRLTFTGEVPASATAMRVTDQTFGEVRIPIHVAMASQLLSNSLIEDSATDIMQLTSALFRENITQDVEFYLAQGTGSGQPEGLFNNGLARANCVNSGNVAALVTGSLIALYWNLPAQYRANAKFLTASLTAMQMASLTDAQGRFMWAAQSMFGAGWGGAGLGATPQDGARVPNPTFLGAPLLISEQCPSMTTAAFPLAFGDMNGYIRADRVGMTVRVLDELYAETDQKLYLLRYRFGGQLAEDYKVKLYNLHV